MQLLDAAGMIGNNTQQKHECVPLLTGTPPAALNEAELHTLPQSLAAVGPGRPAIVGEKYSEAAVLRDPLAMDALSAVLAPLGELRFELSVD